MERDTDDGADRRTGLDPEPGEKGSLHLLVVFMKRKATPRRRRKVPHATALPGGRDAGFTMIEMIVGLVVLGLVAGLVLSCGPAHSASLDMRLASVSVAQALRLERTRAIASNRGVSVVFDTRAGTVQVGVDWLTGRVSTADGS